MTTPPHDDELLSLLYCPSLLLTSTCFTKGAQLVIGESTPVGSQRAIVAGDSDGSGPPDKLVKKLEKVLGITLLGDSDIEYDAQLSQGSGRGLTIADALEDYLTKGESDD